MYKPFQSGRRGEREHEFYERVADEVKNAGDGSVSSLVGLEPLIPRYFGVVEAAHEASSSIQSEWLVNRKAFDARSHSSYHAFAEYLVLEDLTFGRKWPCIMDVKVGTRSFEDDASAEKIAYEKSKFPLQEQAGFRLQGIKVFDKSTQAYIEFDKHFGRSALTMDALAPALGRFLPSDDNAKRRFLIQSVRERVMIVTTLLNVAHVCRARSFSRG